MIGEIGGTEEERGAAFVKDHMTKPVVGFIAGRTAPPGKRMGHAGAVISGGGDTAEAKMAAMRDAGITVCDGPPSTLGQGHEGAARPGASAKAARRPARRRRRRPVPKAAPRPPAKAAAEAGDQGRGRQGRPPQGARPRTAEALQALDEQERHMAIETDAFHHQARRRREGRHRPRHLPLRGGRAEARGHAS